MPVPVFFCLFVPEILVGKYSPKDLKIYGIYFYEGTETLPEGEVKGTHQWSRLPHGVAWGWPAPPACLDPLVLLRRCPFAYKLFRPQKTKYTIRNPRKVSSSPSLSTLAREGSESLPGTLPEGRSSPEGSTPPCLPLE